MRIAILLVSVFAFMSLESYAQTSWEIDKDKADIIVFTKAEEGSDFKSFKAVMSVHASAGEILEILKKAEDYTKWYGYTNSSKLLKQEHDDQYNYVETIFPWPYRNRDMVYCMSIDSTIHGVVKISLKGIPDYIQKRRE